MNLSSGWQISSWLQTTLIGVSCSVGYTCLSSIRACLTEYTESLIESAALIFVMPNSFEKNKMVFTIAFISWHWDCVDSWNPLAGKARFHYFDIIITTVASQITSLAVVYSVVYSDADERKHQSSASLAFVQGIHRDRWIPCTKGQ